MALEFQPEIICPSIFQERLLSASSSCGLGRNIRLDDPDDVTRDKIVNAAIQVARADPEFILKVRFCFTTVCYV